MDYNGFLCDVDTYGWNLHGFELYADDKLVFRFGDTEDNRYPIYSANKTITSIAAGMAVAEGKLDIGRSLLHYLPDDILASMPQEQKDVYQDNSLRRLMCMSITGYPFRPEGTSWIREALNIPIDPNVHLFHYSNISAYLAGVAVACAVDENLYDYLSRKLFAPLGIQSPPHTSCPDGYFYGASSMELSVNEFSRIGRMLYHGGFFGGRRYLSEQYVSEATSVHQMNREGGYGYFIWKFRNGFSINGKWGQKCYVLPYEGKVITFLSHIEHESHALTESIEKHLL